MNGTYGTTTGLSQSASKLIDDLLRRELRVGDPRNPVEIVAALRRRYTIDAARLDQESAGLPIRYDAAPLPAPLPSGGGETPGSKEERRVSANLESDLAALIDSRDNREWTPEIRGWRDTLSREFADGTAAARFAQDPAMRDRGFLAVRKLGEFARIARFVGVFNLNLIDEYRRLASTLDDAANVIRILMGEALYEAGLADGGLIMQVSVVDLRSRRESLVLAVRRLNGVVESSDGDGDWGDGLAAYRTLLDELERRSAPELTVYLREEFLVRVIDGLVGSVSRQDPESLRQVAATAPVEIARLKRLAAIAAPLDPTPARSGLFQSAAIATSATLSFFIQSLQLFVDAFRATRSGARLIDLAVPLPMAAQQSDESDREGRRRLRELVSRRADLAAEVECFLSGGGYDSNELKAQVLLDKLLFDLDRTIDLFAQGDSAPPKWGDDATPPTISEERKASAYRFIVLKLRNAIATALDDPRFNSLLNPIAVELFLGTGVPPDQPGDATPLEHQVVQESLRAESEWVTLIASLAPACLDDGRNELIDATRLALLGEGRLTPEQPALLPPPDERVSLYRLSNDFSNTVQRADDAIVRAVTYARSTQATEDVANLLARLAEGLRRAPQEERSSRTTSTRAGRTDVADVRRSLANQIREALLPATAQARGGELKEAARRMQEGEPWRSLSSATRDADPTLQQLSSIFDELASTPANRIDVKQVGSRLDQILRELDR